ncbi:MAG: glycosyltransferase [Candidatus Hodarchaeales archaeon]
MVANKFTIVVPIKDEVKRLNRSLPTYYSVDPDEVIICTDDPTSKSITKAVKKLAEKHDMQNKTRILAVKRNPEYKYHQAWVRRSGYREAKNDIVLAADIDLYLNKKIHKGIEMVGKNEIGLVSFSKFRHPFNLETFIRTIGEFSLRIFYSLILKKIPSSSGLNYSLFTGLYIIYKPYWLETEGDNVKDMVPPFHKVDKGVSVSKESFNMGEDTFLRDSMQKKYKTISMSTMGGVIMDREKHNHPKMQFERGRYNAQRGRSLIGAIVHTILQVEPNYFKGYLFERNKIRG